DGLNVAFDAVEVARVNDVSRLPVRFRGLPPLRCGAHDSSPHDGSENDALSAPLDALVAQDVLNHVNRHPGGQPLSRRQNATIVRYYIASNSEFPPPYT